MLNPSEAALLSVVVALLSVIVTAVIKDKTYVTKNECSIIQQKQCAESKAIRDELSSAKGTMAVNLRMTRALITYSDMPKDVKEEVLNDR